MGVAFAWIVVLHFGAVQLAPLPSDEGKPVLFKTEALCRARLPEVRAAISKMMIPENRLGCRKVEVPK